MGAFAWDAHCTICSWSRDGVALTQHQADRRASDALTMHLHYKHQIDQPRATNLADEPATPVTFISPTAHVHDRRGGKS